ncbi:hypothetical protein AgCh_030360 [Apium graveolens]
MESKVKWGNLVTSVITPITVVVLDDPLDYVRKAKAVVDTKKISFGPICSYSINNTIIIDCYLVGTPDKLKSTLIEYFSARKPVVINVTIDPYAGAESGSCNTKTEKCYMTIRECDVAAALKGEAPVGLPLKGAFQEMS